MQPSKPHPSPIQEKKHYPHKYPNVKSNSSKRKTDCTLITTVRIWVMDSQNKTKRQSCPCLNIFLMKISGMFLSFSSRWLTKELEWGVHLGVPCLSDIVIERERETDIHGWNQEDVALFEGFKLSPSLSLSGTTTSDSTQDSKKNLPFLAPMSQHTKNVDR